MMEWDDRWDGASIPCKHWHFHRRLLERYGLVLPPGWYGKLLRQINDGKAIAIKTQRAKKVYGARVRGQLVLVVSNGKELISALPMTPHYRKAFFKARETHRSIRHETGDAVQAHAAGL